jgi:hypothetical protein
MVLKREATTSATPGELDIWEASFELGRVEGHVDSVEGEAGRAHAGNVGLEHAHHVSGQADDRHWDASDPGRKLLRAMINRWRHERFAQRNGGLSDEHIRSAGRRLRFFRIGAYAARAWLASALSAS